MRYYFLLLICFVTANSFAQNTLDDLLKQYNEHHIPYISAHELAMPKTDAVILDAREPFEYRVSHLKHAISVGYNDFNLAQTVTQLNDKQQTIVVYCSLGIRSETIADKLKNAGYTNVYNLYGGIFEWKNEDFPVFNSNEEETQRVHAFSKAWSKWLLKGEKVY